MAKCFMAEMLGGHTKPIKGKKNTKPFKKHVKKSFVV